MCGCTAGPGSEAQVPGSSLVPGALISAHTEVAGL